MTVEHQEKQEAFFRILFGKNSGIVCIAYLSNVRNGKMIQRFFNYPNQMTEMLKDISDNYASNNVYFCPQLLTENKRSKGTIESTPCAWADLDTCRPDDLLVAPTVTVESSPGRYQAYWVFDNDIDPDVAEELSKRIAYRHKQDGADTSGWDLSQLLRVPYTYNYKYNTSDRVPIVKIEEIKKVLYRLSDFDDYPITASFMVENIDFPRPADIAKTGGEVLSSYRNKVNPIVWALFLEEPEEGQWSTALWKLEMTLLECGLTREEVFMVCRDAKCNKYTRDDRPMLMLWKEIVRAEATYMTGKSEIEKDSKDVSLITEEEAKLVEEAPNTFVENYINWASGLGDAAKQYHQAGALTILSTLLCDTVSLPTSYGTIIPNLWFMILGDTTLTRKTTSMDIAMSLVEEVVPDALLATDGSIEGLLTLMSSRSGKPSVFLRDEFSGLLDQMLKKDYMAGMAELLTKLYDGKPQRRVLKKEIIDVRDPRLIIYSGGIRSKITTLLDWEHVSSGFMPRFVFITAESDITKMKPIGPPTQKTNAQRDKMVDEIADIFHHYHSVRTIHIEKLKTTTEVKVKWEASMTEEAWIRYNQLEAKLLEIGLSAEFPDIMTPIGDRLSKSILKTALLMAASRQRTDEVEIELIDILRAIKYGEVWHFYAQEIMAEVGKSKEERKLDAILEYVNERSRRGYKVQRSTLMQKFKLYTREADIILTTLEQRGMISRQRDGKNELIYSMESI